MAFFFDKLAGSSARNVSGVQPEDLDSSGNKVENPLEKRITSATQQAKTQIAQDVINNASRVWNSTSSGPEALAELNGLRRDIETLKKYKLIESDPTKQDAPTKSALLISKRYFIDKGKNTRLELDANFVQVLKRDVPFFQGLFESGVGRIFDDDKINIKDAEMITVLEILKNVYTTGSSYVLKEDELNKLMKFAIKNGVPEILNIAAEQINPKNYQILLKYGFDTNNYEIMTLMFKHSNLDEAMKYLDAALSLKNESGQPNDSWETIKAIKDNIHSISAKSGNNYEKTKNLVENIISASENRAKHPNLAEHREEIREVKNWGLDSKLTDKARSTYLDLRQAYFDLTGKDIQREPKLMLDELLGKLKKGEISESQLKEFLNKVITDIEAITALTNDVNIPVVKFYAGIKYSDTPPTFMEQFTSKSRREMVLSPVHNILLIKFAKEFSDKNNLKILVKMGLDTTTLSVLSENLKKASSVSLPVALLPSLAMYEAELPRLQQRART